MGSQKLSRTNAGGNTTLGTKYFWARRDAIKSAPIGLSLSPSHSLALSLCTRQVACPCRCGGAARNLGSIC